MASFRTACLTSLALLLSLSARADEGMWTFDNLPMAQMKAKYGFHPDQAWLDHVRLSALLMDGGSASFVSADGLVLTNHHMGHGWIQQISTKDHNYVEDGFVARNHAEEIKVPGATLRTLMEMVNVTAQVDAAVTPEMNEAAAAAARKEALGKLVKAQEERTKLECRPVIFYQGGQVWIYAYKVHTDIRLVMAPEYGVAAFGKDWDNFSWPRHDLDFCLLRVYQDGKPYKPAHHLSMAKKGAEYGDMTFTVGHPGRTERLLTLAQMEAQRDVFKPIALRGADRTRKALHAWAAQGPEQALEVSAMLMGTENGYKVTSGDLRGLLDVEAMAKVAAAEKELRAKVAADPKLAALAGDSWTRIEEALAVSKSVAKEMTVIGQVARTVGGLKRAKGEGQAKALAKVMLQALREELGEAHPLAAALLQGRTDDQVIAALKEELPEAYRAQVKAIAEKNQQAQAIISEHQVRIAKARFAVYGAATYPDATGTLRLSYGAIESYPSAGTLAQPFTTYAGMFDRAAAWGPKAENASWALPRRWMERRGKLDLFTPYNFISTNDITGGNSGSPVVDRRGELIGLAFDGNIESLPGRYYFDGRVNRTLCVDPRGILEALAKVYDAPHLAKELSGSKK